MLSSLLGFISESFWTNFLASPKSAGKVAGRLGVLEGQV